jgi:DNA-binding transcriptional MocR family regulator
MPATLEHVTAAATETLYEQVVARIEGLIDAGTLRVGQKIPSVRKLSRQLKVSVSTVLQAYRLLEDRGRIEARPQSGYYVKAGTWRAPPAPTISKPSPSPTHVSTADLAMRIMQACAGGGLVPLGGAIPGPHCLPTAQLNRVAASIARRSKSGCNIYDVPPGCRDLRVQVARRSLDAGCALSPDDFVTTCGGQEALYLCLRAVTEPGDTVAIESPTYYGVLQILQMLGLKALEVPTCPETGPDLDALRSLLNQRNARGRDKAQRVKACLFIPNYSNPLGSRMPDDAKRHLVEMLADRDVALIEDDIFGDLGFTPHRPKVCKAYDESDNVLLCSSFSKTLAPGWRVGWCAPGSRYRERVMQFKATTTLATPTLFQMAIADYLATGGYDHHLRKVRKLYAEQLAQMTQAVQRFLPEGTRTTRPQGGSVLWVQLPGKVDALRIHDLAYERGISIAPGPMFSPNGKYRDFLRLNCGWAWDETFERALITLGQLVRDEMRH